MKKLITATLMLTILAGLGASLHASKRLTGKQQAICAHRSHGSGGWTSSCTSSYDEAYQAAQRHMKAYPEHYASTISCTE